MNTVAAAGERARWASLKEPAPSNITRARVERDFITMGL
jgi:hypothetical protein